MSTIFLVMGDDSHPDDYEGGHEWPIKAFSDPRRAMIHVESLKHEQEYYNTMLDLIDQFSKDWETSNPAPDNPYQLMQADPKFPARAQEITQAMKDKRARIRAFNDALQKEYADEVKAWNDTKFAAINKFLELTASEAFRAKHLPWSRYYHTKSRDKFFIQELELD